MRMKDGLAAQGKWLRNENSKTLQRKAIDVLFTIVLYYIWSSLSEAKTTISLASKFD